MSSIRKGIDKYLANKPVAFHSPAHSGTLNSRDLSELTGLDDLQYPSEIIKESQDFTAKLFSAQKSLYLVNGASVGIQASLMALKSSLASKEAKSVLVARNVHKSVIAGLILSGLEFEFFEPEWLSEWVVFGGFNQDSFLTNDLVKNKLEKASSQDDQREEILEIVNQNFSALLVTNPTYEGFYSDLKSDQFKIPVIVDEAHGAHYHFSDLLPKPALECGADIVIQSWHKCLGSLTQTGVLHINHNSKISPQIVEDNLRLLQSTSPSYVLLESICLTAHKMAEQGEAILERAIRLAGNIDFEKAHNHDPLRVLFKVRNQSLAGETIDELFEEKGIALESYTYNAALAFINITNTNKDLGKFNEVYSLIQNSSLINDPIERAFAKPSMAKQMISPREAFYSQSKKVKLDDATGKISQELFALCPPGIAILIPGQEITQETVNILKANKSSNKDFVSVVI